LDFGLVYKVGKPNRLFRLETLFLNGTHSNIQNNTQTINTSSYGGGIRLGLEFRKDIVENLFFSYGFGIGALYARQNIIDSSIVMQNTTTLSGNVNLLVGINYVLKDHWVFSVEALPFVQYDVITTKTDSSNVELTNNQFFYELDIQSIRLVIAYRFGKTL